MAFFKFRFPGQKGGDDTSAALGPAESIEVMRRRARHRLIGAAVLVAIGVIGFPLLFDTQPRPIAVDIPIEIPDKGKVKPLPVPSEAAAPAAGAVTAASPAPAVVPAAKPTPPAPSAVPQAAASPGVSTQASLDSREEVVGTAKPAAPTKPEAKHDAKHDAKPETKAESKPAPKPEAKAEAKADDGGKARALLDGKDAASDRFIVQVGAFSDVTRARETRLKVEKAGIKTYTQVVETEQGKRIRVRVGPFANRAEADKAAARIKGLDLPASILTL